MNAAGTVTYFLWDGLNLLQTLNADGSVKEERTNSRTRISGIGQLVEIFRPSEGVQKIYPIMDPRGAITKWMQSDGTTILAAREYDAFGQIIPNSATGTWPSMDGYQGQAWEEILSANGSQRLILTPTRIYNPSMGLFISKDPLVIGDPAEVGNRSLFRKDFDSDSIESNSQDSHYTLPARLYISLSAILAQMDPLAIQIWKSASSKDRFAGISRSLERAMRFLRRHSLEAYSYTGGRPTLRVDPQGLLAFDAHAGSDCADCEGDCSGTGIEYLWLPGSCLDVFPNEEDEDFNREMNRTINRVQRKAGGRSQYECQEKSGDCVCQGSKIPKVNWIRQEYEVEGPHGVPALFCEVILMATAEGQCGKELPVPPEEPSLPPDDYRV